MNQPDELRFTKKQIKIRKSSTCKVLQINRIRQLARGMQIKRDSDEIRSFCEETTL